MRQIAVIILPILSLLIYAPRAEAQYTGAELRTSAQAPFYNTGFSEVSVACPPGKVVLTGGYKTTGAWEVAVVENHPVGSLLPGDSLWRFGWYAKVRPLSSPVGGEPFTLQVFAVCASAPPIGTASEPATPDTTSVPDVPSTPSPFPEGSISGEVSRPTIALVAGGAPVTDSLVKSGFGDPSGRAYRFDNPHNLAESGGTTYVKDVIQGYPAIHDPAYLTDGRYGNGSSWIGTSENTWVKIDLGSVVSFNRVRFGRDRTGWYDDRDPGRIIIAIADEDTGYGQFDETEYTTIVPIGAGSFTGFPDKGRSVEVAFPTVTARFVKITFERSGVAIDEVEVYLRN